MVKTMEAPRRKTPSTILPFRITRSAPAKLNAQARREAEEQIAAREKLEIWIDRIVQSNQDLASGLKRLRDSYHALLEGQQVSMEDRTLLTEATILLQDAARARELV